VIERGARFSERAWVVGLALAIGGGCSPSRPEPISDQRLGGVEVGGETLERGRSLFTRYCASCHGNDGSGAGPAATGGVRPRDFRAAQFVHASEDGALPTHDRLVDVIRDGVPENGMPAWKGLRNEDLDALAHYIKTFSPRWSEPPSKPDG
jgi:mono/diheme cytochrome c family protein